MTPELKPCPFCGGEAVIDGEMYYWVRCKHCKVETRGVNNKVIARNIWNNRVGDTEERMQEDGE